MSHALPPRPVLPLGWFYPDSETVQSLHTELQRELQPGHLLSGRAVEAFAWREGATDDVLFRHRDEPQRFTVIHLSWIGNVEIDARHPTVEFDGTFSAFLATERALYGLTPPEDA